MNTTQDHVQVDLPTNLVNRTITFRRVWDGSQDSGHVVRELPSQNAVVVVRSKEATREIVVHRSNIVHVQAPTAVTKQTVPGERVCGCEGCDDLFQNVDGSPLLTHRYRARYVDGSLSRAIARYCYECACHVRAGFCEGAFGEREIAALEIVNEAGEVVDAA